MPADDTLLNTFRGYMDTNGLSDWSLNVSDRASSADTWDDKSITISQDSTINTAMHTLAHALVGSDEHSSRWRAVAVSLGVDLDEVHPELEPEPDPEDEEKPEKEKPEKEPEPEPELNAEPDDDPTFGGIFEDPSEGKGIVPPYVEEKVAETKTAKTTKAAKTSAPIVGTCPEGCTLERKRMPSKQVYCKPHDLPVKFTRV